MARSSPLAFAAAIILCLVLGSLHAFSVLIPTLESSAGLSRAATSAIYSIATFAVMLGVLAAPALWQRAGERSLAIAGAGASVAVCTALTGGYAAILAGLGFGFGIFNGLGYAAALRVAGDAFPHRKGLGMGLVTAAYCGGAILYAWLLAALVGNLAAQLLLLGISCAAAGAVCLVATGRQRQPVHSAPPLKQAVRPSGQSMALIWAVYLAGVAAGLMVLGHAAALVRWSGGGAQEATTGAMLVSTGSLLGSLAAGAVSVKIAPRPLVIASLSATALAAATLALHARTEAALAAILVCGLAYGSLITAIPILVEQAFEPRIAFRAFTIVFTAWGFGGLLGPLGAGWAFAATGSYSMALQVATALSVIAAAILSLAPAARRWHLGTRHGDTR